MIKRAIVLVLGWLYLEAIARAETEEALPVFVNEGNESAAFYFGTSCALLADLGAQEVRGLVNGSNQEYFVAFCRPENLYVCSDYNSLLRGHGVLEETSSQGSLCRFVNREDRYDRY